MNFIILVLLTFILLTLCYLWKRIYFGVNAKRKMPVYHDLDKFSGTWNKKEAEIFLKSISDFERIDKELWK